MADSNLCKCLKAIKCLENRVESIEIFFIIKTLMYLKGFLSLNLKAIAKELSEFSDFFFFFQFGELSGFLAAPGV